jgi:hypothetical protein
VALREITAGGFFEHEGSHHRHPCEAELSCKRAHQAGPKRLIRCISGFLA